MANIPNSGVPIAGGQPPTPPWFNFFAELRRRLEIAISAAGVTSFNSRTGDVAPAAGDYSASEITNDSSVTGTNVDDALDQLASDISAIDTPTTEEIQDIAGAMWTGNTETFITITYQDADGTIDAVVPVKDEDDFASDSDAHLATQQSIKAYVDSGLSGKLDASSYTASDVLTKIKTVDGSGSGLDADTVDGSHASAFAAASHNHDDRYYTETESDAQFQPLDTDLTAIAALTTTAAGRSVLAVSDPGTDRPLFWDDSAGEFTADISQIATNSNPDASAAILTLAPSTGQLQRVSLATLRLPHDQVRAATTANITISTALNSGDTLDGAVLDSGDRVLVKNQSTASENGIYIVGTTPARASDYDSYDDHCGVLISVQDGTTNANTVWRGTSTFGSILDAASITFEQAIVSTEAVQDLVGAMFSGNTETFITATYQDGDGTVDLVVPVLDEDDMVSNSASHLATQQSIKAYVDAAVGYEEGTFTPTITAGSGTFGSVSGSGRYIKFGKLVAWRAVVVITTVGTATGQLRTTLPFTAGAAVWPQIGINASTGVGLTGNASAPSTTQAFFLTAAGASPIAANTLVIGGVYEAAS